MILSPRSRQPAEPNPAPGRLIVPGSFVWHPPRGVAFDRVGNIGSPTGFSDLTHEIGAYGRAARGASNRREVWAGSLYQASTSYTVIAAVVDDTGRGISVREPISSDDQDTPARVFQLRFSTTSVPEFIAFNTGGTAFTSTGTVASSGTDVSVITGRVQGAEVSSWLNGVKSATATLTGTARTQGLASAKLSVGASARAGVYQQGFGGQIYLCLYLPYAVSDAVLRSIKTWQDLCQLTWAPRRLVIPARVAGAYTLTAATGAFAITGQAAALKVDRKLTAAAAAFSLTGNAAGLRAGRVLSAGAGAFALTGQAATLTYTPGSGAYSLTAETGTFSLTGRNVTLSTTAQAVSAGGGGWAWAAPKKKRHDYLSRPTREQMAERVRKQREALGILPKPAQKRIEAAVKKEARRASPDIAELAPVAAEVAQDTGASLQAVIDAIAAVFQHQRGLIAARFEADAAQRQEAEAQAAEQARADAETAQKAWQKRLVQLRADDDALLKDGEKARQQAIKTIRGVQKALLALLDR